MSKKRAAPKRHYCVLSVSRRFRRTITQKIVQLTATPIITRGKASNVRVLSPVIKKISPLAISVATVIPVTDSPANAISVSAVLLFIVLSPRGPAISRVSRKFHAF